MKCLKFLFTAFLNCTLLMLIRDVDPAAGVKHRVALLIIDVQDCFLPPNGSLAVPEGDQVVQAINRIRRDHGHQFSAVVLSQDWHCSDHVSFASQHPDIQAKVVNLTYNSNGQLCQGKNVPRNYKYAVACSGTTKVVSQTLWPDHCIRNRTSGPASAEFSISLKRTSSDIVVRKGESCGIDSYSAFFDNGGFHQTKLNQILKDRHIDTVVVTGLALDYCVYYTSKDAYHLNYTVLTVTDAARGVTPNTTTAALKDLKETGVRLIKEAELGDALEQLEIGSAAQLSGSSLVYLLLMTLLVVTASSCQ